MLTLRILSGVFAAAALAQAACDQAALFSTANAWLTAQQAGSTDALTPLLDTSFSYQQNNKAGDIKSGILSKALKLDYNRTITDLTLCASYSEIVATGGPYVIGVQILHTADGSKVSSIDTMVATTGDWSFNAKTTLSYIVKETWGNLDVAQRSSRDVLKAAADAYLDMWSNSTAINAVPWGNPCERIEGSSYVSPSCKVGAPTGGSTSGMKISMRRYVIDEVVGSIDVFNSFGGLPDSHEFRLVSGTLRYVHTITI